MLADTLGGFRRLADDLPWSIWTQGPDGVVDWANRAWYEFSQLPREIATVPEGWLRVVHPDDYNALIAEFTDAVTERRELTIELRLKPAPAPATAYRWFFVRSTPRTSPDGASYWLGSAMDVHEAHVRNEEQERGFRAIAQGIPEILWTARPDGSLDWYNDRWYEYTGQTPEAAVDWGWAAVNHPDDIGSVVARWRTSLETGAPYEVDARLRRRDGTYRWFVNRALPLRDESGAIVRWCGTSADVDDARRARAREQLYARMTEEMSTTLSLEETLRAATRLVVPEFGDYAVVNLLQEDGEPVCVAAYHRDLAYQPEIETLTGTTYIEPGQFGTRYTLSSGHAVVYETLDGRVWEAMKPEFVPLFRRLGLDSAISVPLHYRGVTVGTLGCVMSGSGRRFSDADLPLFEEIARRIAPAIANAEAYERERRVAQSFQEAAMAQDLPRIPGLRFDGIYQAANAEATVGGDWYDAVRLPDGRVVVSIGDVAGSGLEAAVTMGSVRQSIRTAALINPDPATVLEAVDRIVRALGGERFVTAFVALLDPLTFELRHASAGHPSPLLRRADGTIAALAGGDDLPLGLRRRDTAPSAGVQVPPGSLLVAFTDGLTEFDRDPISGERAILAAVAGLRDERGAEGVYRAVTAGRPARDDVAVLTIAFDTPLGCADGGTHVRTWRFATDDAAAANAARAAYAATLRDLGVPNEDVISAELIFAELVGNAYRHAPGEVEVILDASSPAPVLHVLDSGSGFEYRPRLPADVLSEHGRGLFLVRALADEMSAERRDGEGTHVRVVLAARPRTTSRSTLARDALV